MRCSNCLWSSQGGEDIMEELAVASEIESPLPLAAGKAP